MGCGSVIVSPYTVTLCLCAAAMADAAMSERCSCATGCRGGGATMAFPSGQSAPPALKADLHTANGSYAEGVTVTARLPWTVLRRLDCLLAPTRQEVLDVSPLRATRHVVALICTRLNFRMSGKCSDASSPIEPSNDCTTPGCCARSSTGSFHWNWGPPSLLTTWGSCSSASCGALPNKKEAPASTSTFPPRDVGRLSPHCWCGPISMSSRCLECYARSTIRLAEPWTAR